MGECVCGQGFCRPCHCRRIAAEREARPGYKERHAREVQEYWDRRSGVPLLDEERPMMLKIRGKGLTSRNARLVLARSRLLSGQPADRTRT